MIKVYRWIIVSLVFVVACATLTKVPTPGPVPSPVIQLFASGLPQSYALSWDASVATFNVTSYTVTCDAGTPVVVLPTPTVCAGTPARCGTSVPFTSYGPHSCQIVATNTNLSGGTGVTGSPQNSDPATVLFNVNQQPPAVTGFSIK